MKTSLAWILSFHLFFISVAPGAEGSSSVYDVDYAVDLPITAGALITATVPYLFAESWITRRCPCNLSGIPAFERSIVGNHSEGALVFSDVALGLALTGPVIANYFHYGGFEKGFWDDAVIYAQVLSISGALVSVTKVIAQRPLPRAYAEDPEYVGSARGYRSFYSGHASTTMAALASAAFTLNVRKQGQIWPWLVAGGMGVAVGLGRIAGGVHFYSDVIVGLGMGTAVGILVPLLHRQGVLDTSFFLSPQPGGASLLWARRF